MPIPHRRLLVLAAAGLAASPAAFAQPAWPDRPVRVVVPYPPGGSNDILARILAETLRERLPQPWIVENRAGANGNVGADAVAKAPPDGHALLLTAPGPLAINDRLYRALPYDPARDLAPVALVATVPIVLMATNALPVRTVPELVALARREPGRLAFGSSGNGSTNHLAGELLKALAGIEMVHVPYRGAAPAMTDLVAGQVQVMFDNMPGALPQIREGRVQALAVAGARRAAVLPKLPTVAEAAGLPDFAAEAWFGLAAPGGTPPATLARIGAAVLEALAEPGLRARFAAAGAEPGALDPAGFAAFVAAERRKWARVVEASGARAE
jgi:tripartite-type tricarboxylate transporter receptor subunit TctC